MDSTEFEQFVIEILDTLPPAFLPYFENVEVIIEPRVSREASRRLDLKRGETVYGLYQGVPLTQRSTLGIYPPDTITIFQEPLVRDFPFRSSLREQIRRTVLHELAHHLGISDERLRELGAY